MKDFFKHEVILSGFNIIAALRTENVFMNIMHYLMVTSN